MHRQIVTIYSVIHFVVDFACAALIARLEFLHVSSLFAAVVFYNFFAFFMQWPLGIIADRLNKNALVAAAGCTIVAGAFCFSAQPLAACVVAGIGNALFHLGGGIDVLNISGKKATLPGIFVSTGALGLFLGASMAKQVPGVLVVLLISIFLLLWLHTKTQGKISNLPMIYPTFSLAQLLIITGLVLTVCLRSYVGFLTAFSWKTGAWLPLIAVCAVVAGKMLGGLIGDKTGFIRTAAVSLAVAAIGFIFAFQNVWAGVITLICFNMTMPLTLTALTNLMPNNKGMAFGLLTAALFVGAWPVFYGYDYFASPYGLLLLTVVSAALLLPALWGYKKEEVK